MRLARPLPHTRPATGARHWVGFDPAHTYTLDGGLRIGEAVVADSADGLTADEAARLARALAPWRADGQAVVNRGGPVRTVLDAVGTPDPMRVDFGQQWAARRTEGRDWMRFPIGSGE